VMSEQQEQEEQEPRIQVGEWVREWVSEWVREWFGHSDTTYPSRQ
jgi:hypothetical protein